jgi:hypothetical protein
MRGTGMERREYRSKKFLIILMAIAVLVLSATIVLAETDVTSMVKVTYSNAVYDRVRKTTSYDVTLTNTSSETVFAPLIVVIENITPSTVTVVNPDGVTADGKPHFDFSNLANDGRLSPNETSQAKRFSFNNPQRARFEFLVKVVATPSSAEKTVSDLTQAMEVFDIDQAVNAFDESSRARYLEIMEQAKDFLPQMAEELKHMEEVYRTDDMAKYKVRRVEDGVEVTYYIYFVRDENGVWKIFSL